MESEIEVTKDLVSRLQEEAVDHEVVVKNKDTLIADLTHSLAAHDVVVQGKDSELTRVRAELDAVKATVASKDGQLEVLLKRMLVLQAVRDGQADRLLMNDLNVQTLHADKKWLMTDFIREVS